MAINEKQTEMKSKAGSQIQKTSRLISTASKWGEVENARKSLKETFGFIPSFFGSQTDQTLPGAWTEVKNLRFSQGTALDIKLKGLIGLAVSSQIPCEMINYFDKKVTLIDGATKQEQCEAVMMSALTRHWSTVLNGSQIDKNDFKAEADKILTYVKKMMDESRGVMPPEEMFLSSPSLSADDAYADIEKTLGLFPKFFLLFPKEGIAPAWSEFKALQLNPYTALSGKEKELIGLSVAAQIPCDYCVYFHRKTALFNGASERELQEAVAISATVRHWSTVFHSPMADASQFREEADRMVEASSKRQLQS